MVAATAVAAAVEAATAVKVPANSALERAGIRNEEASPKMMSPPRGRAHRASHRGGSMREPGGGPQHAAPRRDTVIYSYKDHIRFNEHPLQSFTAS